MIVITGATGQLGSLIVASLLERVRRRPQPTGRRVFPVL